MKSIRFLDWRSAGKIALFIGGIAVLLAGCNANNVEKPAATPPASPAAPPDPTFKPVVSINALMVTWIDNSGHVLWDVEKKGFAPKDEADWTELEDHATQLAAAGSLIQMGGTGQRDPEWAREVGWNTSAQALTTAALADLSAAKSRNLEAVIKANGQLVEACEACHKQFKPELPSEGILHQRPHSESHKSNR